ncbi:MAG: hypothetical protein AAF297_05595 [Planctomycetota bacterium]
MTGDANDISMNATGDAAGDAMGAAADERAVMVSRIVDGAATPEDWATLRTIAGTQPEVWAELSETQSQNELLTAAVGEAVSVAHMVELPTAREHAEHDHGLGRRIGLVRSWGGWAAAAAIALLMWNGVPVNGPGTGVIDGSSPRVQPMAAGLTGPGLNLQSTSLSTPDEALQQYIDLGRQEGSVIAAMPEKVVLETRELGDGTAEVLYLRQILERRIVDQFYTLGTDEFGRAVTVEDPSAGRVVSPY